MNTIEGIKSRRSTRKFLDKDVPDEIIRDLIDAARHAPFGGPPIKDCQPWEFIVIRDNQVKAQLALKYDDRQFLKTAPVLIAVCTDTNKDKKYKEWEPAIGLATENILLAAQEHGLGACYLTAFIHHAGHVADKRKLREILRVPAGVELISILAIGYPDPSEKKEPKELRAVSEITHRDGW